MDLFSSSKAPSFTITDREGNVDRQIISPLPFLIGRQSGNHLLIRDARASRHHARVVREGDTFTIEDLGSRHGVFVNGQRIGHQALQDGDCIEFGFPDSYTLRFETTEHAKSTSLTEIPGSEAVAVGGNLARLQAILEIGRSLETSFSIDSVLCSVVDAALVVTKAERGFLLIHEDGELRVRCARDRKGALPETDLAVPHHLIQGALDRRSHTFSVQFQNESEGDALSQSAFALELKSAVCVPLVRVQMSAPEQTTPDAETAGVLYLDSRSSTSDLAIRNRELLESLALQASSVLENARLLEQERRQRQMEAELAIAREVQQSLLPPRLPDSGWMRAAGHSTPSRHVGGDYFDVFPVSPECWAVLVADVAGKGVSSALVASLIQGASLAMGDEPASIERAMEHVNRFLRSRTEGLKYATVFCALLHSSGRFHWINAGHCGPVLVSLHQPLDYLAATSPPVGLLDDVSFEVTERTLESGDRLVLYSDGVTDARNNAGEFFGRARLEAVIRAHSDRPCSLLHRAVSDALNEFTGGADQTDDVTLLVIEYRVT